MIGFLLQLFLVTPVFSSPLLIWSQSDVGSAYDDLALGTVVTTENFASKLLGPKCNDAQFKFIVYDVNDLTLDDFVELANSPADNYIWSFLKGELNSAMLEKLVEYEGSEATPRGCDVEYIPISYNSYTEKASVSVDGRIEKSRIISNDGGKKVIYMIRGIQKLGPNGARVFSGPEFVDERRVLRRRSADPDASDDSNNATGNFIYDECFLMNYGKIWFQPLGGKWESSSKFEVTGWKVGDSDCKANQTNMTVTFGADITNQTYGLTSLSVEIFLKTYIMTEGTDGTIYFKYWYADTFTLSFEGVDEDNNTFNYSYPLTTGYIAAPQDKSYACQVPDFWPMQADEALVDHQATLLFSNLQFDVNFIFNGSAVEERTAFSDGIDCESKLGKGGVITLLLTIILLFVTLYILGILSSAQNPVFGDKQIVVAQE